MLSRSLRNLVFKFRYGFKGVPFQIADQTIRLDESLRRWNVGAELSAHQILAEYLGKGDIFIDVGANFGLHTLYAAKLVGNQGHVFAFEPVLSNLKLLQKNVALSGVQQQVEIVSKALSNSSESFLTFYLPPEEVAVTASICPSDENIQTTKVANVRLDDYWSNINLPVHLIKIDVEGAELEVLRGAEKLLKQWQPQLLIEVHGFALPNFNTSVDELREFLKALGYQERLLEGDQFHEEHYFQALYSS
ncbi:MULTISPECIES: FkbM family methyltransferase [unclassified Coleofasciculus]|uniref:FkbM family methyltransferase n=1 Tax=unclassified Coleofasciculus TaxID=2692782 RepID=UPI00187FD309|nr:MULTISPECIES: FkbM family methyltransferase [unclassified Coleofasciculus]MBE9127556.1 FkbM family methyltransferase [Coleofasciculus sp. LEGE 07081]MBE9147200.1 FkbM family methyltransferase [Coleofasciculus sp. LEGE 07092]